MAGGRALISYLRASQPGAKIKALHPKGDATQRMVMTGSVRV